MRILINLFFLFSSALLIGQEVKNGLIDLSNVDLKNNSVELSGEWEFYWNNLLEPENIGRLEKDYYAFPTLWNGGTTTNGIDLQAQGYGTYRLKVVLPPARETPQLSLAVSEYYSAYKLYYNGFEFEKNGDVGVSEETSRPDWMPKVTNFANYSDTITLVLQMSNFRHTKGGAKEPIILGDRKLLNAKRDFDFSYDFLLSGSLIMGGLFFLGLFLFGQHEKSVLFFALFCLSFSYRMVGSGEYAFHALYPDMSWLAVIRSEYISLFVPTGIFTVYSYSLYPEDSKKWVLLGFSALAGLFALLSLFAPPLIFTKLIEPFFILLVVIICYLVHVYWTAYKRNRTGAQYAFASTGIVFLVAVYLISIYLTPIQENTFVTFIGFIFFFFFQSLILSYRFAHSLRKAKDAAEAASQAKTDFLSTISHEIRTPLNAVVGISHFLANEEPRKDQKESLESLQFSAEHLTTLINDILDYNKLESGAIEFEYNQVNLHSLAMKTVKTHQATALEKNLELKLEFDQEIERSVLADDTRIYQVLNNLINNALKFTSEGFVKLKFILLEDLEKIQKVRIEVQDSGIGIPSEKLEVIFERFTQAGSSTTREYGGTGLGLAIIRRILHMVNSEINVDSEVGEGSRFWFDLGFIKTPKQVKEEDNFVEGDENVFLEKEILLVEDNQMNIMVAQKFLKKWNLKVDVAKNGQLALDLLENKSYDLILMDLQMPVMDGYIATRKIRETDDKVPIIALTASALLKVRKDVIAAGMNDYVTKPFNPTELKRKIGVFLAKTT